MYEMKSKSNEQKLAQRQWPNILGKIKNQLRVEVSNHNNICKCKDAGKQTHENGAMHYPALPVGIA